ncbi:MAG: hypothetical protein ACI8PZ_000840 [Myxococcota bacterium]|jgi:hypothetical protein
MLATLLMLYIHGPAFAGRETQHAEVERLTEEAAGLAARGAWTGVDRSYQALAALADKGVPVDVEVHMLGARAAQELGDLRETYMRLVRARQANSGPSEAIESWIAKLDSEYQLVHITALPSWKAPLDLVNADMGFVPAHKSTIDKAVAVLEEKREFVGLLPHGRYSVGPTKFELVGGAMAEVVLKRSGDWEPEPEAESATIPAPAPAAEAAPSLTAAPTTLLITLGSSLEDAGSLGAAADALKSGLLEIVDVLKVEVFGIAPCYRVTPSDPAQIEPLQEALVPHGTLHTGPPPYFTVPSAAGHPASLPLDAGGSISDLCDVERTWCPAPGVRRVEVTVDAGVHLAAVRGQLAEIVAEADPALEARLP